MALYTDKSPVARFNLSGNRDIDALFNAQAYFRVAWSNKVDGTAQVSYSFPSTDSLSSRFIDTYGYGENRAITGAVNAVQAAQIAGAFGAWSNVANVAFTAISENSAGQVGDIRIGFTSKVSAGYWGYALGVSDGANNAHGDIWIDKNISGQSFAPGTYNYYSMMHEIGHSLGLKHPFETPRIATALDNRRYTIMSYTDPASVWWRDPATGAAQYLIKTPMVYDIQAIQKIYGPNTKYQTGDNTYAFAPGAPSFEAIWDAGGTDTISVAAFTKGCTIDLRAGSYSSLAYDSVNLTSNIGIAFGCVIENAVGGAGADTVTGTETANRIEGGAGADTLTGNGGDDMLLGGDGNDTLVGGAGNDTLNGGAGDDQLNGGAGKNTLVGGEGFDTASYASFSAAVRMSLAITGAQATGGGGYDTLSGIEALIGGSGADTLTGSDGANTLNGGAGNDTLNGGGGNDLLIGGLGRDTMTGGAGSDTFFFAAMTETGGSTAAAGDLITDFSRAQGDRIDLSAIDAIKATSTINEAFTWIGTAAFTKHAGELRHVASGSSTLVLGDIDGNGVADLAIGFSGNQALSALDFYL